MAKTVVTVCDECGRVGVPTRSYTITRDSDPKIQVDLCADHGEELELCIERSLSRKPEPAKRTAPARVPRTGAAQGRSRLKVTSLAEIEKLKKK